MNIRHIIIVAITLILFGSVATGVIQALEAHPNAVHNMPALENVRDYMAAGEPDGVNYAVDAGALFAGVPGAWTQIPTPDGVIVSAVAVDAQHDGALYIGAANELAIYRSLDAGENWLHVPLSDEAGGVTDIALDSAQRLVYAGTDTAGLFRLRDVGSSVILNSQLLLDEPVRQVVADSTGAGLAFARTDFALYRAENYGLTWLTVDNLLSSPTALAVANTIPATFYVGTTDRGVLTSTDGLTWTTANDGLDLVPGSRLHVDALAADPTQPGLVYAATSYLYGSATLHQTPSRVSLSDPAAQAWTTLHSDLDVSVAELLPVSGHEGAVYALTTTSRSPLALGNAPAQTAVAAQVEPAPAVAVAAPAADEGVTGPLAWIIAGFAAIALLFAVAYDVTMRRRTTAPAHTANGMLEAQPVRSKS